MTDSNNFAEQFVQLLDRTGFPDRLPAKDALKQLDAVIAALTVKLLADVGAGRLKFYDFVFQGRAGGGGPHRLDLLVRYSTEAARSQSEM
jgi:hypothetical protein